ncbi:lipopolysaccharide biosynthesis protein [Lactococcus lactis]|nr:lipopolysaccharide biosynthesis protein [Lactococcus lactis]MCT1190449.1 lipopolysaccharide biosynthesis protein [Lactococcus lactis]
MAGEKLYKQLKNGLIYTALGKVSNLLVTLIVNAILSRLLTPADYGIVAIVQVFILFFQMIVEAGMGPAIIQNKQLTEDDHSSLFNFSFLFSILLSILFGFFGFVIARIYGDPIYIYISWFQSIAIFFNGLTIVPLAILNKSKEFKKVNFIQVVSSFLSGLIGTICAFNNFGVYSLIISSIILALSNFIGMMTFSTLRLSLNFNSRPLKQIMGFSIHQFFFNFINYFSRNADNILVGKYMGTIALGNYNKSYQLLMMPNSVLLGIINPVLQPILSEYENDVNKIKNSYLNIVKALALIGVSLSIFLSIFAKEIIEFIFGNQWSLAVVPFRILALTVWVQMTLSSSGAIFQARNKAKQLMVTGTISAVLLVSSIIVGIYFDSLTSLAICLSIGFLLNFLISFHRLMSLVLDSSLNELLRVFVHPFIVGAVVALGLYISSILIHISSNFIYLVIQGLFFVIFFTIGLFITKENQMFTLLFKSKHSKNNSSK